MKQVFFFFNWASKIRKDLEEEPAGIITGMRDESASVTRDSPLRDLPSRFPSASCLVQVQAYLTYWESFTQLVVFFYLFLNQNANEQVRFMSQALMHHISPSRRDADDRSTNGKTKVLQRSGKFVVV